MIDGQIFDQQHRRVRSPIDARLILNIRWLAIIGQLLALLYTYFVLEFAIAIGPALFIVALSALMNIWQTNQNSRAQRKDSQNFPALVFDILQLSALLFFTGGLLNPFSTLILASVVVAAAILRRRETLALIVLVAICVTFLTVYHYPLPWGDENLVLPDLYVTGLWMAMVLSAFFIGGYAWRVASGARRIAEALSEAQLIVAKKQQTTALGTLATAAAHELGSPLNTITVISHELAKEITRDDPIYDDVQLLRTEVERCRIILAGLDELQAVGQLSLETPVPLNELINGILNNRFNSGMVTYAITVVPESAEPPLAKHRPELVQALQDILGNADTFAVSTVNIRITSFDDKVTISITDDGPGFPSNILARMGQPWNSSRYGQLGHRGLGIFVARTLIEALGGSILFRNSAFGGGDVSITLPAAALTGSDDETEY